MIEKRINEYLKEINEQNDKIDILKKFLKDGIRQYKIGSKMGGDDIADYKEWTAAYQHILDFINRGFKR